MAAEHPQHGSGARVRSTEASVHGSAPVHGSGAELRSTAVNDRWCITLADHLTSLPRRDQDEKRWKYVMF